MVQEYVMGILVKIKLNSISYEILIFFLLQGGAYIVKKSKKSYLRGIVSSSLLDNSGSCDIKNFAVFTDTAKFTTWIKNLIEKYA